MKALRRIIVFAGLLGFSVASGFTIRSYAMDETAHQPPNNVEERWAVLAGVEHYIGHNNDLPGVNRDLDAMARLLKTRGFSDDGVHLCVFRDATRQTILDALAQLKRQADSNDAVIFYFCGHGASVPDTTPDEPDAFDEALIPADGTVSRIASDTISTLLLDDDIENALEGFKTENLTLIFDSCYSGEADKAEFDVAPAALGIEKRIQPDYDIKMVRAAQALPRHKLPVPGPTKKRVFISSSQEWQKSRMLPDGKGSEFTMRLIDALRRNPNVPWNRLVEEVGGELRRAGIPQDPTVTGGANRYPFSLKVAAGVAPTPVQVVQCRTLVTIGTLDSAPTAQGKPKTHRVVFDTGRWLPVGTMLESLDTERDLPRATVRMISETIGGEVALAKIEKGTVRRGDKFRVSSVPFPEPQFTLALDPPTDDLFSSDQELKASHHILKTALAQQRSRVRITSTDANPQQQADFLVRVRRGPRLDVWEKADVKHPLRHAEGNGYDLAQKLCGQWLAEFSHMYQLSRLVRLHNPAPPWRLEATVNGKSVIQAKRGERVTIQVQSNHSARVSSYFAVRTPNIHQPQYFASGPGPHLLGAEQTQKFTFDIPLDAGPTISVKIFAIDSKLKALPRFAPSDLATSKFVDKFCAALTRSVGGDITQPFISTRGWADVLLTIQVE